MVKREIEAAPRQRPFAFFARHSLVNTMTVIHQPPFSPDLAPADFILFPKKRKEKGLTMLRPLIKKKLLEELKSIPEEDFQWPFLQWKRSWEKCIDTQGEHFEGDKMLKVFTIKNKCI